MTKIEVITFLKTQKSFLYTNFGVIKIGLFGSYARDKLPTLKNEILQIDI